MLALVREEDDLSPFGTTTKKNVALGLSSRLGFERKMASDTSFYKFWISPVKFTTWRCISLLMIRQLSLKLM